MKKLFTWDLFLKVLCSFLAISLLTAIIIKLANNGLSEIKLETLLLIFGITILLPYISKLEAFGVKMEVKKRVDNLSAKVQALPDYVLASEYHSEGDYTLAERSYRASMEQSPDFWPAIFGLACVYHDREEYEMAIMEYNRVLGIDPNNIYVFNNLAEVYLISPMPLKNPKKALEMAEKALLLVPALGSALYYKAEALNRLQEYSQAKNILKSIISNNILPAERHWAMFELCVAKSNLGNEKLLEEDLDRMFFNARDNGQGKRFLNCLALEEEQDRFKREDIHIIRQFLKKNENYVEKNENT